MENLQKYKVPARQALIVYRGSVLRDFKILGDLNFDRGVHCLC